MLFFKVVVYRVTVCNADAAMAIRRAILHVYGFQR
jgi:hypothetical protein